MKHESSKNKRPSAFSLAKSILGAALGVQSERQRQQDFSQQSFWPYIWGGAIFTAAFVAVLLVIVQWVIG